MIDGKPPFIRNPFLQVFSRNSGQETGLALRAPLPGKGLQSLDLTRTDELTPILVKWLNGGKTEADMTLSPGQRDVLVRKGIVVSPEKAPREVRFSCFLDE